MFNIFNKIKTIQCQKRQQARRKIVLASLFTGSVTALLTFFTSKKNGAQNRQTVAVKSQGILQKINRLASKASAKIKDSSEDLTDKVKDFSVEIRHKADEVRDGISNKLHSQNGQNNQKAQGNAIENKNDQK